MKAKSLLTFSAAALIATGCTTPEPELMCEGAIQIRAMSNLGGEKQVPVAQSNRRAIEDYVEYVNANDVLHGCTLDLGADGVIDDMRDATAAQTIYEGLQAEDNFDDVVAVLIESNSAAGSIADLAAADEIPVIAGALRGEYATPVPTVERTILVDNAEESVPGSAGFPAFFSVVPDNQTLVRSLLTFAISQGATSIRMLAQLDDEASEASIRAARHYANSFPEVDFEVLNVADFRQAATYATAVEDYYNGGGTAEWIVFGARPDVLNDVAASIAAVAPAGTKVVVSSIGESLFADSGVASDSCSDCEGRAFGVSPITVYGNTAAPFMSTVVQVDAEARAAECAAFDLSDATQAEESELLECGTADEGSVTNNISYVIEIAKLKLIEQAILSILESGKTSVSRADLFAELESGKSFELGGLVPPVSYSSDDHRGSFSFYGFAINDFNFSYVTEIDITDGLDAQAIADWKGW